MRCSHNVGQNLIVNGINNNDKEKLSSYKSNMDITSDKPTFNLYLNFLYSICVSMVLCGVYV